MKKYRSQFQIRIKPSVPKSELAAAIAEHFASIPVPEENEVIDQFLRALQKARNSLSEAEESADEPAKKSTTASATSALPSSSDLKKKFNDIDSDSSSMIEIKNSSQSNSVKKSAKRNSVPKVEST